MNFKNLYHQNQTLFAGYTGIILFVILCVLWLPWLGETPFYSKGEPREAIVAVSMLETGDWILPSTCGGEIPFKPPFCAWLTAVFALIFNGGEVNEYISRLPSALAAIGLIMMGYAWARKAMGQSFAFMMGIVTATAFEVFRAAEASRVDMVLTAAMVGAMYMIYEMSERRGRENIGLFVGAAALLTVATLTKGPIGALLPCMVCGVYLLLRRENFFMAFFLMLGLVILSSIVPALWYYAAWKLGGESFLSLAMEENIGRLTGTMSYGSHENPFWYNFVTILSGMLPWTLIGVFALFRIKSVRELLVRRPMHPSGLFALVVACGVVLFYCIPASKRSVYLLPAYPFIAYGVTLLITRLQGTWPVRIYGKVMAILAIQAPIVVAIAAFIPEGIIAGFKFEGWLSWVLLVLPVAVATVWWCSASHRSETGWPLIVALLIFYNGALMPAIFHNPLKTEQAVRNFDQLKASSGPIYIIGTPNKSGLSYWSNYYLGDRMRHVPSIEVADRLPQGSTLWLSWGPDTAKLSPHWEVTPFGFNPDTRKPAWIARKVK